MAKRMLSLLLAAVMVLGMVPVMNLSVSAEEQAQTSLMPLWSEDFETETTGADYSGGKFTVNNNTGNIPHHYNLNIAETAGDKYLHVTYNEEAYNAYSANAEAAVSHYRYGFYAKGTQFPKAVDAVVLNFKVKFGTQKNTFIVRLYGYNESQPTNNVGLIHLLFDSGKITYGYGDSKWSNETNNFPDLEKRSATISKGEWHELQFVGIQRSGDGESDYWALLENGEVLLEHEGDYQFGKSAAKSGGFNAVDVYVQTSTGGTVQMTDACLDDFAAYEYVPATSINFAKSEYTVQPGGKVQTAVVVTPTLTMPAVKPTYTSSNIGVATVDANGRITGVAAGTATITATLTNHDGSVKTAETTVKVEGPKILWDSDFDSEALTPSGNNFSSLNNLSNGKWYNNAERNTNGGYDVKIRAEESDASDHYLSIKAGTATGATPVNYRYVTEAFANAAAIDVRFNIKLHEEGGYRDNLSLRLHPKGATDGALMELYFTKNGLVQATNATLNASGYTVTKEAAAAGLNVRIVAIQNPGTDSDEYRVYINGTLALEGATFGGPYPDESFQRLSLNTSQMGVDTFTSRDTRIDDLVVYEYVPTMATGVTLDAETLTLKAGKTTQLAASIAPADADSYTLSFASDKEAVATVSQTGLITAVAEGTAKITVTLTNSDGTIKTDTVTVTVPKVDPNLLWSEDFESHRAGNEYPVASEDFVINRSNSNYDHPYELDVQEVDGDNALYIHTQAVDTPDVRMYAFYGRSPSFGDEKAIVANFSVKFTGTEMNTFQVRMLDQNGGALISFLFTGSAGTVAYDYGDTKWSTSAEFFPDITKRTAQISPDEWHDLQFIGIQRTGEGEKDYWALLEDGVILLEHEGNYHFGRNFDNSAATQKGFGRFDFYVQEAGSGKVQVRNTWLDDLAVYRYIPATGVALDKDSYALTDASTAQAAATVSPDVVIPGVKVEYSIADTAVATVDANGLITGKAGGTTTLTAKVTNFDGTVVTDTATVVVEHVEAVLWDSDFDSDEITGENENFNLSTNYVDSSSKWWNNADRNTNGSYNVKIVADGENQYLKIASGATLAGNETATLWRYRSSAFAVSPAVEMSMRVYLHKDAATGYQDNFYFMVHPQGATDGAVVAIMFADNGTVKYRYGNGNFQNTEATISGNEWHDVRLVVIQSDGTDYDCWKLYVDDQLVLQDQKFNAVMSGTTDLGQNGLSGISFQTSTATGRYTNVDTRIDDLKVRTYTPVQAEGLDVQETAITVGKTPVQLHATVTPANADAYKITWTSSNEAAVTVSSSGLVSAMANGSATVTATLRNASGVVVATDTVEVTVDAGDLNLLWSDDFDDSSITAADGQYTNTDKWGTTNNGSYNLRVVQDPANAENKVLHLTSNAPVATTDSFAYVSTAFAGREILEFSFDAWIGYDAVSKSADWFQFSVCATTNQPLVNIVIWNNGTFSYATTSSTVWSEATSTTVTYNTWHNFRIVVMQREGAENDMWQLWMDDKLIVQQNSFIPSSQVDQLPSYVRINTSGSSSGNYTVRDTYLDNMQVNVFTPVAATAVVAPEAIEAEIDRTAQLTVTATPADASLYKLSYKSADENIVMVDENGKVTGVTEGSTTITVTLTNADGTTCTDTVAVTAIPAGVLVWEEDFDDKEIGSAGGFTVNNTNPDLGFIRVQDATECGGTDKALVMNRKDGGLFVMNGGFELPTSATKMVLEYKVRNASGDHHNTVLPTLAGAYSNSKRFLSLFINNSMLYWNNGEAISVQSLSSQKWYTIKLIIDTEKGEFQLYLDGALVASETKLLYGNAGDITHVYFQASPSDDQTLGDGVWMDDFKVSIYLPVDGLEMLDDSVTIEGQSSQALRIKVTPEDATGQIIFTSSDESIATVDGNGVVTGVTPGEVTITAETFEGVKDTVKVIVQEVKPTDITVSQQSLVMPVGAHTYIYAEAYPSHATPNVVTKASSDESIVTVDEWGEVVCLKAGSAKLILSCGDISVEVPVTVTEADVMQTIQVSPNGTSIADALAQIAAINATAEGMIGNIEVILADGYYYMSDTIEMNQTHGGTNGYSVIWKAAAGATPIIGGAKHIAGSQFADADSDGIYTIDLGALGIPKVADPDTMSTTRQLFVDNIRATRARSKGGLGNAAYWKNGNTHVGHVSDEMLEGLSLANDIARPQDLEFVYKELWSNPRCGVEDIFDNEDGTVSIKMDQPGWKYCSGKGNSAAGSDGPVWIENALELLDEPGEWYLNEETQILYYMPRSWEKMSEVTFTLPLLDSYDPEGGIAGLMYIAGKDYDNMVQNIRFEGITFADTTWTRPSTTKGHSETQNNHIRETSDYLPEASITVTRANGVCFTGCTFTRLGITAVKMIKGVQNSFFVGNHFYDISGGAINIGEPAIGDEDNTNPKDPRMMMKNDDVLNNYIHDIGVDFLSAAAISLGFGPNMDFSYNEIFNMPYSGYHIGYGWTSKFVNNLKNLVISNNFIHDFMGDGVADGGGVYTIGNSGGNENSYNQVCYNFVKTVLDDSGPLYMDNGATFYEVHHNVVDLSKVTDWRGNKSISWLQMNSGASKLKVHDNYATVKKYNNYAVDSEVEDGHLEVAGQWSNEALAIINGAGLQGAYAEKYKQLKHAELIVLNLEDGIDMNVGDIFSVQVSYTDGKDVAINGVDYVKHMESLTPDVVTLSADGQLKAVGKGKGTVRIWVVSNDILDVIERTVYVNDDISEIYLSSYRGKDTLTMSNKSAGITLNTTAVMDAGRVLPVDAQYLSFTVENEAVAKVVNGSLVPVSNGSTKLTVKVDMNGMTAEVIYQVKIVNAASFEVSYMEDMFASEKSEWSNANVSGVWTQENDSSVTIQTSSWITYRSATYENELLTFKLRLDTSTTSGWPCIFLRADRTDVGTVGGGASSYVFVFGNESKGLEVQRWNGKTRTMIAGNLTGFPTLSGKTYVEHPLNDNQEHLVQVGALTDGGTTYLAVYVDGKLVFDYLDESADAIVEPGYFGIVGRNEKFYLSKASAEEVNREASVGGKIYGSFAEALAAAKAGETIQLLADVQANGVLIKEGIGLDLNGYNLTANYLVVFGNGKVVDTTGDGLLKCDNVRLAANNPMMPVWDAANNAKGYRFFDMVKYQQYKTQDANGFVFQAKPALGKAANDRYLEAMDSNRLTVKARIYWKTTSENEVEQLFTFKPEDVAAAYQADNMVLQLTVTGAGAYAGKLWTSIRIESETGVIWEGVDAQPYTGISGQ